MVLNVFESFTIEWNSQATYDKPSAASALWLSIYPALSKFNMPGNKFVGRDVQRKTVDVMIMRMAEVYLIAAEAECRLGNDAGAREYLMDLMSKRDASYSCAQKSGTSMGKLTSDYTGSLLEEIIIQRRIELWGEFGRIYDIRRLKQGFKRTAEMGWPTDALLVNRNANDPESYMWVLTIPQLNLMEIPV